MFDHGKLPGDAAERQLYLFRRRQLQCHVFGTDAAKRRKDDLEPASPRSDGGKVQPGRVESRLRSGRLCDPDGFCLRSEHRGMERRRKSLDRPRNRGLFRLHEHDLYDGELSMPGMPHSRSNIVGSRECLLWLNKLFLLSRRWKHRGWPLLRGRGYATDSDAGLHAIAVRRRVPIDVEYSYL